MRTDVSRNEEGASTASRNAWLSVLNAQVIGQREECPCKARIVLRLHAVDLVQHYALQGDIAVLDDDVNRRESLIGVVHKIRVIVDGSRNGQAELIVKSRYRQDLEIVSNLPHAFHALQEIPDISLLHGLADLAVNLQLVILRLQNNIVEDRVEGIGDDILSGLFDDLLVAD